MSKNTVIYPFFFAAYSVLGMYSANINEVRPGDVIRPLLFALFIAGLLLTLFYLIKRDWHHAGFLSVISVIALLYFGHSTRAITPLFGNTAATYTVYAMIVFWGLVICLAWTDRLWKLIHGGPGLTFYLNITGLIVLIVPTIIAASDLIRYFPDRRSVREYAASQLITTQADPSTFPDIYFIILDGYGRQDVIKKLYGLDNSVFIHWLEGKGFYVANQSQSNYMRTKFALASTLNLGYISDNDSRIQFLIEDSAVQNILENLGYTIIGMPSAFLQTQLTHVDKYYSPYSRDTITLFEGFLIQNSLLGPFAQALNLDLPLPSYDYHREVVRYTFDKLPQVAAEPGPKFVFAHILAPHPPFSFHEDGSPNNPDRPFSIEDASDFEGTTAEYIQGYSEQLKFANNEIPIVIQEIMDNSTRPFVIILQGDHGGGAYLDFDNFDANGCFVERFSILNAYYFSPGPGRAAAMAQLTPDITPVNSFRVILNAYMGTNYELLPGRQYYSTFSNILELIDVTGQTTSECRMSDPSHIP
jgi:hypothetical protein